jgi:hypothetical protein
MSWSGNSHRSSHIVLQSKTAGRWEDQSGELSCNMKYLRAGEAVLNGRLGGISTVVIRIRETAARDADLTWRIKDKLRSEVFAIGSIIPTDCGRWLEFTCQTGVPT